MVKNQERENRFQEKRKVYREIITRSKDNELEDLG